MGKYLVMVHKGIEANYIELLALRFYWPRSMKQEERRMLKRLSLSVSVILLLALTLVGCGSSKGPGPEQVASSFFDALIAADWEKANSLRSAQMEAGFTQPSPEDERLVNALVEKMSFEVGKATVTGQQAEVPFDLTMPDLDNLLARFVLEIVTLSQTLDPNTPDDELAALLEDKLLELLDSAEQVYATYEGTMRLQQEEGAWKVLALEGVEDFTNPDQVD